MEKIILASNSPRRRELLAAANIKFSVVVSEAEENFPSGMNFQDTAIFIATNKAKIVKENYPDNLIIAADTIVVCDNRILGKPKDKNEAIEMLNFLSGKTHEVITGVCILKDSENISFAETTEVEFHNLSEEQIKFYVENYKPFDKAGGYAIQEWLGMIGIKNIHGDYYNVVGLPVNRVYREILRILSTIQLK